MGAALKAHLRDSARNEERMTMSCAGGASPGQRSERGAHDHELRRGRIYRKGTMMKKTYKIDVDCANCANKMEQAAKKTNGVKDATVNFMALKMKVEFEDGAEPAAVMQEVRRNCKIVEDDCEIFL